MPNTTRRTILALALVGLAAGCSEPLDQPAEFAADLRLAPTIEAAAPVPAIDRARIRIGRAPDERILDTLVTFPATGPLSLRLRVALKSRSERLDVTVDLQSGGQTYYSGTDTVLVVALGSGPAATPTLVLRYVGPGAAIRTLRLAPRDSTLSFGDPLTVRISALDAQGAAVADYPVTWSTNDTRVAITQTGAIVAPPLRIAIKAIATIPTGLADSVTVTLVPKAVAVGLVGGANQTGRPSTALPTPFTVIVKAADSLPMAGVSVRFGAIGGGGGVRDTTVITNAQGQAATTLVLGGSTGTNRYQALVSGLPTVVVTATAVAGPPAALLYQSGGAQVARVNTAQAAPLVVLVTDSDGFPVEGATVNWAVLSGGGQVNASSSATDANGIASMTTTTAQLKGLTLVRATIANIPPAQVTFTSFGTAGPATTMQTFSGDGSLPFFPTTLRVRLSDAFGNPVAGTTVNWNLIAGVGNLADAQTVTGADGLASVGYSPLSSLDVAVRAAAIGGLTATFNLRANPNPIALIPLSGGDQTGFATQELEETLDAELRDFGTPVIGGQLTWQIIEGGGSLSAPTSATNSDGIGSVAYTAGTRAGTSRIRATHTPSGQVANFSVTIEPDLANRILVGSGDNQSGNAGAVLALPLRVVVTDVYNNPIAGYSVAWTALDGGIITTPSAVTDQFGVASTTVRLGSTRGPQRFRAALLEDFEVVLTATAK